MTRTVIPTPELHLGLIEALEAAGLSPTRSPDGLHVKDEVVARLLIDSYVGSNVQLEYLKGQARAALADLLAAKYAAGFPYAGKVFQIDQASQFNISAVAVMALAVGDGWDGESYFIAADNSHLPLPTAADAITFASAAKAYVSGLIRHNRALKDAIAAAVDTDALDAVDLTSGWPK